MTTDDLLIGCIAGALAFGLVFLAISVVMLFLFTVAA